MEEPPVVQKRALDVTPLTHGIWCTVGEHPAPFVNAIVSRKWSDDGKFIWFMLDSHNFHRAEPDEMIHVVETPPFYGEKLMAECAVRDAEAMARRPAPAPPIVLCSGCGHEHCATKGVR